MSEFTCQFCDNKIFASLNLLKVHQKSVTCLKRQGKTLEEINNNRPECEHCGKKLSSAANLRRHYTICQKNPNNTNNQEEIENNKPECEYCNKKLSCVTSLKNHYTKCPTKKQLDQEKTVSNLDSDHDTHSNTESNAESNINSDFETNNTSELKNRIALLEKTLLKLVKKYNIDLE